MTALSLPALELLASAAVHRSLSRVVRVRGEDARSWLNGQISNDVQALHGDEARYALALTIKGRILSDLWALEDGEGMALVLPSTHATLALEAFEKHIIMEDVELVPSELDVLTVQGPRAHDVVATVSGYVRSYACPRLTPGGMDVWVKRAESDALFTGLVMAATALGGGALDAESWAAAHVALQVPRVGVDFDEHSYPQEAGLARAVSFGKGCYLGQEVIYMLEKRGQLARRLVQLEGPLTPVRAGTPVLDGEQARVGNVTSTIATSAQGIALAYVKRAFAEPGRELWLEGSPWRVRGVVGSPD